MRARVPWEVLAAPACAFLSLVPGVRFPAIVALLCFLPGVSIARHWLGVRDTPRLLILGGLLSLAAVPLLSVPLALLAGESSWALSVGPAVVAAVVPALTRREILAPRPEPLDWRPLALLAALAILLQAGMTARLYPAPDTVAWTGLPDYFFFQGVYTQLHTSIPPMDPEHGDELLVHNWIYHFHFVQMAHAAGLSLPAVQRLASAWLQIVLLGMLYLLGSELLRSRLAGLLAALLAASSGEIYWLIRSAARGALHLDPLPWDWSPMGITMLFGWYNLAPLTAALGTWYCFERSRRPGGRGWLAASLYLCCCLAFYHPIFYGVFMSAFCLWLGLRWLQSGGTLSWALFLLTPLPFFLLYKFPYYGWSMPPSVVHFDPSIEGLLARGQDLLLWGGILFAAGIPGLLATRHGFMVSLTVVSVGLVLFVDAPNPHWFNDLLNLILALSAGAAIAALRGSRFRAAASATVLLPAFFAFALQFPAATASEHKFSQSDLAAAAWLATNSAPDDLLAILPNSSSSYTLLGLTRRRVVHGFTEHIRDFVEDAETHEQEVAEIFHSPDPARAHEIEHMYGVSLVYVGPYERRRAAEGRFPDPFHVEVFTSPEVQIFRPACSKDCRWREERVP